MNVNDYTGETDLIADIEDSMMESYAENNNSTDSIMSISADRIVRGLMIFASGVVGIGYFIGNIFWFLNILSTVFVIYFLYRLIFSMLPIKLIFYFDKKPKPKAL